jgi:uncharacterized protein (TIGR02996 family)
MARKKATGQDAAFLADVAANPEDDSPRLVYADWLEDNGQPHRAEFIRLQCRLASMDEDDPERLPLVLRESDLLFVYGDQWPELPAWARMIHNAFRRGFLDRTSMTAADLLKRGHTIFAAAPVTDLEVRAVRDKMAQVAACPLLDRLTALRLEESSITPQAQLTPEDLRVLGTSPHLGKLRALELPSVTLTREHARALADWPVLPRLRRLEVCPQPGEAFAALARPGRLASLEHLIYLGPFPPEAVGALAAAAPALARLELIHGTTSAARLGALARHLPVKRLRVCDGGSSADALAEPPLAEGLASLELERMTLSMEALASLTTGSRLAGLRRLSLNGAPLGAAEVRALASAPLHALTRLDLRNVWLDAEAVGVLAASPNLAGLRWLDLSHNAFGDAGAAALAKSPYLRELVRLDLTACGIGPAGAAVLAASPNLATLRSLELVYNPLGDDGLRALADSPHLGGLHVLGLNGTRAGAEGIRALVQARGLGSLRRLSVTGIGDVERELIQEFADPSRLPRLLELDMAYDTRYASLSAIGRPVVL